MDRHYRQGNFFSKPSKGSDERIDGEQGPDRRRKEHGQEATKPHAISPSTTTHPHPPQHSSPYVGPKLVIPLVLQLSLVASDFSYLWDVCVEVSHVGRLCKDP